MNIETALREGLADQAAVLDVPADPWPSFVSRESRHRRNRRVRSGVVAVALAGVLGLQSGMVPMPGWAPGIAIASSNDAMVNSPTRGSLAGDQRWLDVMRTQIKDLENPGEMWKVTDRSEIKFLYAGDVGHLRLILAYVPLRFGFVTSPQLIWYEGAAGAVPEQMEEVGNVDGSEPAATRVLGSTDGPGVALVVGPQGSTASISSGYEFTAEGRVRLNPPVAGPAGSGVAQMVLPASPGQPRVTMSLTRNGRTVPIGAVGGWGGMVPDTEQYNAIISKALGTRQFDRTALRLWVRSALDSNGLPLNGTRLTVRWTGTVNNQSAALFTLQIPDRGVLAFAMHGTASNYRAALRLLLPAADASERPIAWRLYAETGDGVKTDQAIVVAPNNATSVKLTTAGDVSVKVKLDKSKMGTFTLAPDTAGTVTAYAADGSKIGSTPVTPFDDGTGITGETPATRVVP